MKSRAWILVTLLLCISILPLWSESTATSPTKPKEFWLSWLNSFPGLREAIDEVILEAKEEAAAEVVAEKEPIIAGLEVERDQWKGNAEDRQEDYQVEHERRLQAEESGKLAVTVAAVGIPTALIVGGIIGAVIGANIAK